METRGKYQVAVIGAGPAGLFAAKQLAAAEVKVALLNRDIKPGGLAEYGIYYDKHKMKEGLRKQFRQILENPDIEYYGNIAVGQGTGFSLDDLRRMGFQAVLVTVGAQGTKWLGLPGEDLKGVYHAKDIVYHYNSLPPFSEKEFAVCCKVALVGVGNVMMDIAHWLVRDVQVEEVIAVARRGPAEVKFTKKEMESVGANLDLDDLEAELARCSPAMENCGQSVTAARDYILAGLAKALEKSSHTRFHFEFLASPTRIMGDEDGYVCGLEVEDTTLIPAGNDTKVRNLGTKHVIPVDSVIFCIGDKVDETFGLPVARNEFVKHPDPKYPVDGLSYEAYDPAANHSIPGVFVAGWSREASSGLVGVARKDGENGAHAVLRFLQATSKRGEGDAFPGLEQAISASGRAVIRKADVTRLEEVERAEAQRQGVDFYKMKSNEEMLNALGLN